MAGVNWTSRKTKTALIVALPLLLLLIAYLSRPDLEPRRLTSPNFTLVTQGPVDAEGLIRDLEQHRLAVLRDWGLIDPPDETDPITMTFVRDGSLYDLFAPSMSTSGLYMVSVIGDNILIRDRSDAFRDKTRIWGTARHESVHALSHRHLPFDLPTWANEGVAEFYSFYERLDSGLIRIGSLEDTGHPDYWPDLSESLSAYAHYPGRGSRIGFYRLSHMMTHLLLDDVNGIHAVHQWHNVVSDGYSMQDAAKGLLSPANPDMHDALATKHRSGKPTFRIAENVPVPTLDTIGREELSEDAFEGHLRRLIQTHRYSSDETRDSVLETLADPAPETADQWLVEAFRLYKEDEFLAALRRVDQSLRDRPDHAPSHLLNAMISVEHAIDEDLEASAAQAVTTAFDRAFAVSDAPFRLHFEHVDWLDRAEDTPENRARLKNSLTWLRNNRVHARRPGLAASLVDHYVHEDRAYARILFITAMQHMWFDSRRRSYRRKYHWAFRMTEPAWEQAFPGVPFDEPDPDPVPDAASPDAD